jgi:bifunctional N-acetylglucosamine-1-phosphate-uridyltransferase/glucosamine-1-phosphate-acetyltransferase GlmU-like protein
MVEPLAIILAAGKGKRMASDLPKVLVPVCGRPMIHYVVDAVRAAGVGRMLIVVGFRADLVRRASGAAGRIRQTPTSLPVGHRQETEPGRLRTNYQGRKRRVFRHC